MNLILRNNLGIKIDSCADRIYTTNAEKIELINDNFSLYQIDYDEVMSWDYLQLSTFLYYSNKIRGINEKISNI